MKHFLQQFDDMGDQKKKEMGGTTVIRGLTDLTHVICGLCLDP